jgi:hypothetical protein
MKPSTSTSTTKTKTTSDDYANPFFNSSIHLCSQTWSWTSSLVVVVVLVVDEFMKSHLNEWAF